MAVPPLAGAKPRVCSRGTPVPRGPSHRNAPGCPSQMAATGRRLKVVNGCLGDDLVQPEPEYLADQTVSW